MRVRNATGPAWSIMLREWSATRPEKCCDGALLRNQEMARALGAVGLTLCERSTNACLAMMSYVDAKDAS